MLIYVSDHLPDMCLHGCRYTPQGVIPWSFIA